MVVMRLFIFTLLSIVLLEVNAMAITINIYYTGEKVMHENLLRKWNKAELLRLFGLIFQLKIRVLLRNKGNSVKFLERCNKQKKEL